MRRGNVYGKQGCGNRVQGKAGMGPGYGTMHTVISEAGRQVPEHCLTGMRTQNLEVA